MNWDSLLFTFCYQKAPCLEILNQLGSDSTDKVFINEWTFTTSQFQGLRTLSSRVWPLVSLPAGHSQFPQDLSISLWLLTSQQCFPGDQVFNPGYLDGYSNHSSRELIFSLINFHIVIEKSTHRQHSKFTHIIHLTRNTLFHILN